ncbi:TonB family protein [Aurantiacibacter hainanensis]|uniref:TonB family protein n=1 Tax=Aurantiacibacter hainanensis TaxID=3076114 RepID=UPI0030C6D128
MSYVDTTASPAARMRAVAGVVAIHALVGVGVVAGLTITGVIAEEDGGIIAYFEPDPPAPPPPPPQTIPEPAEQALAPVTAAEPPIPLERNTPFVVDHVSPDIPDEMVFTPPPRRIEVPGPVVTPSVAPAFDPVGPVPRNGPAGWITNDDYPRRGITRELEGTSGYRLVVGSGGRVDACEITRSSGHSVLDGAVCGLIERRARFDPAKDGSGERVVGTFTGTVTWQLPRR